MIQRMLIGPPFGSLRYPRCRSGKRELDVVVAEHVNLGDLPEAEPAQDRPGHAARLRHERRLAATGRLVPARADERPVRALAAQLTPCRAPEEDRARVRQR